ncbi:Vms1/Ankzf1 family peptidyl-tRNA hydrolase [Microbacterium hydrocarbonoxydans]|uniref:baeRF2 domain-containing protein n=1 Tax=Microbacterium hydrocarbonoxydans TaxID=273678 RepID=UPI0013D9243B|nr:Vms1/Ankzf1 family peptidyl-tRNA hydrolase [Microbacterium hydrocarbonoxydans]
MIGREELTALLERPGPWTYAYVDGQGAEPQVVEESRRESVRRRLSESGAPEADAEALAAAVETGTGLPAPSSRYLLAADGEVAVNETVPGPRRGPELIGHAPIPPVLPLLRDREGGIRYLVVEAGRGDAVVTVERAGRKPDVTTRVEGRTDALPKVGAGGRSHSQYQRTSEEIWKHNQEDLAAVVERLARRHSPRFVIVAGDVRARQLLLDQLGDAVRELAIEVDAHTHAAGADRTALEDAVAAALDEHLRSAEDEIADDAATDSGRSGARGLHEVIEALRQARVDRLLLDARMLGSGRTLDALDDSPWVAADAEGSLNAGIVARIPEAEALARAALLTGADVVVAEDRYDDESEARDDHPAEDPVAVLRWGKESAP